MGPMSQTAATLLPVGFITSGWNWLIILVILLLLFGRRLPGIARSLGQGITEFKKGLNEGETPIERELDESPRGERQPKAPAGQKSSIDDTSV